MKFNVGDSVKKVTGDYAFNGTIVAAFRMLNGGERYVVEHHDCHMLHIFSERNLALEDEIVHFKESLPTRPHRSDGGCQTRQCHWGIAWWKRHIKL